MIGQARSNEHFWIKSQKGTFYLRNEIKPLTGIRGLAAFVVMLYHYFTYPPFTDLGFSFLSKGYLSVDLFFILSGFILAVRYHRSFDKNETWITYGSFLKTRFARIYPAYFVCLFLYYAKGVINISGNGKAAYQAHDVIANLFLVQSWGFPTSTIVSDSWSVSTEFFAYLLFPFLLSLASGKNLRMPIALTVMSVGTLAAIAGTSYGVNGPLDAYRNDNSLLPLLRCIAGFSLGLIAHRLSQNGYMKSFLSHEKAICLVLFCLCLAFYLDKTDVITVALFPCLVLCLSKNTQTGSQLFGNIIVHHLGKISYSLYLLHPFFLGVAGHYKGIMETRFGFSSPILFLTLGVTATWLSAYLSYRYIEEPGRDFLNHAVGKLQPRLQKRSNS